MKRRADLILLIVLFIALFVGSYFLARPEPPREKKVSTTYNADRYGVKAFYTLLGERLGYKVARLTQPYTNIPREASVLVVVQPEVSKSQPISISEPEREALQDWVRGGGMVLFASDKLINVPFGFSETHKLGEGMVYAFNKRDIITNKGMRDYRNATRLLEIITRHASKRDLILFDEYHHGIVQTPSMWDRMGRQVKIAFGVFIAAILVAMYSRGRRFGAVRELPSKETMRPGIEFVESVGRLYEHAHATDIAAEILCDSFKHDLCGKLGLPVDATQDQIASALRPYGMQRCAERVTQLITRCERSRAGHKPSERELVEIAREVHELEKELNVEPVRH